MQAYSLYVRCKNRTEAAEELLRHMFADASFTPFPDGVIRIAFTHDVTEESDFEDASDLLAEELGEVMVLVLLPENAEALLPKKRIARHTATMKEGFHTTEVFLFSVLKNAKDTSALKKNLEERLSENLLKSALALAHANLNVSEAAKRLHIHRNTMLYRIDSIHDKTGIEVRFFQGAALFHMLFSS